MTVTVERIGRAAMGSFWTAEGRVDAMGETSWFRGPWEFRFDL